MKVKITKATMNTYWYADRIGKVFEVKEYGNARYMVIGESSTSLCNTDGLSDYTIDKEDCEVIHNKPKFSIGSKVIVREVGSRNNGDIGEIIGHTDSHVYPWRLVFHDGEHNVFAGSDLELIQECQCLTKATALKLCIDGAKVVNEYVHGNEAHILWDGKEFMLSYDANESNTQKANGVLRGERWKLWTPPQPPTPKFATDTFVTDKDGDYGRIVSMEYEGGTWIYSLSDCVANDCLWDTEEAELTVS